MPIDVICFGQTNTHADAETERRFSYKRGDIVDVLDGIQWNGVGPFIALRCATLSKSQVQNRLDSWEWRLRFEVLANDPAIDGWRLRAVNDTQSIGVSAEASLTRARVEALLNRWNASVVSVGAGTVTFDVLIFDAIRSEGFWGDLPNAVSFVETAYDPSAGLHTVEIDYSTLPAYQQRPQEVRNFVRSRISENGGTWLLDDAAGTTLFSLTRAVVRERFRAEVSDRLGIWRRRRYRANAATIDQAIASPGGVLVMTATQLNAAFIDRWAE